MKAKDYPAVHTLLIPTTFFFVLYASFGCAVRIVNSLDEYTVYDAYLAIQTIKRLSDYIARALLFFLLLKTAKKRHTDLIGPSDDFDERNPGTLLKNTFALAYVTFVLITATGVTAGALWSWHIHSFRPSVSLDEYLRSLDVVETFSIIANALYVFAGVVLMVKSTLLYPKNKTFDKVSHVVCEIRYCIPIKIKY